MTQDTEREKFNKWLRIKHCGAAHDLAWEAWKARAALEAKQAEVKMPEPAAYAVTTESGKVVFGKGWMFAPSPTLNAQTALYTKHQLRTLLAQHGINIAD